MFEELADTSSPYFLRRVKLLETVAKLEFCVLMIDTGSEDLILKMFSVFYDVVREQHPQCVLNAMSSTMALILKEKVSESLLVVTLQNLLNEAKEWERPKPGRRPDIFPQFSPMKTPLPPPMPYDPPEEDEEEEEKKEEEEDPEKEEGDNPESRWFPFRW